MFKQTIGVATAAAMILGLAGLAAGHLRAEPLFDGPSAPPSDGAPFPMPPTRRGFGPNGPNLDEVPNFSHDKPARPPNANDATAAPDPKPPSRQEMLDRLFARLAKASDPDEASGIAALIERFWMQSGSDTADLLMSRAMDAMGASHRDVALSLLDKVILLEPDWAEAWNKRATLRFLDDDDSGAMEDIGHTLVLEPRHFGALSGMGFILKRNGLDKGALTALRRAQSLYPESPQIKKAVDELVPEVEGRDL